MPSETGDYCRNAAYNNNTEHAFETYIKPRLIKDGVSNIKKSCADDDIEGTDYYMTKWGEVFRFQVKMRWWPHWSDIALEISGRGTSYWRKTKCDYWMHIWRTGICDWHFEVFIFDKMLAVITKDDEENARTANNGQKIFYMTVREMKRRIRELDEQNGDN